MGRPRKSIDEHMLKGNYRPSRHGLRPPLPDDPGGNVPPSKPADLDHAAGQLWDKFVRLLAGVLRERDGDVLAELCRWLAELRRIRVVLLETVPGEQGYNQLLVAAGICSDKFDKLAARFGLTPADRTKLRAEGPISPPTAHVPSRKVTRADLKRPTG